jgi:hypothetical protein
MAVLCGGFDVLRVMVAAANDQDVLDATSHVELHAVEKSGSPVRRNGVSGSP